MKVLRNKFTAATRCELPRCLQHNRAPLLLGFDKVLNCHFVEQLRFPADPETRNLEEAARWLLANLLDWHRRESKADWWEYFRLKDLTDDELLDERSAISGIERVGTIEVLRKIPTDRYRFEKQETDVRAGDVVCERGEKIGEVIAIDIAARTFDIKKTKKTAEVHPTSVFVDARGPKNDVLADALFRLGTWVNANGVDSVGPYRAARDLLLRLPPRLLDGTGLTVNTGESTFTQRSEL